MVCYLPQKNERTNLFCLLFYSSRQTNQIRRFVFWENLRLDNLLFGFTSPLAFILYDIPLKESYFILLEYSFILLYRCSDNSTRKSKSKLRNGKLASTDEFFKNDLRKMIEMMNYSVIYCSMTQIFNLFFLH